MRPVQEGGPEPFRAVAVRRQPEGCLFCRWCLDTALSRPVTALDNERFTVQSVMLHYAVPVVLAGFLITNALRFMFKAPGVTSWQYTLLQLQARVDLLPAVPCALCCSVLFPPS